METAAVLNLPEPFEFEGQTFQVARKSFEVEGEFERFCAHSAYRFIFGQQAGMNPLDHAQAMARWEEAGGAFAFAFDGPRCFQTLISTPGQKEMIYLRLKATNPQPGLVTRDLIDRLYMADAKWNELIDLMKRLDTPNAGAPGSPGTTAASA